MSTPIRVRRIVIDICVPCLEGIGQECHTPECARYLHRVDLRTHEELYHIVHEYDSVDVLLDNKEQP